MSELARWGRGVIKDIDLSADGRWIAVAAGSGVYIHDAHDLSVEPRAFETTGNVTAVSISPTGDKIAFNLEGEEVQVWQVEPPRQLFTDEEALQLQFSPDGDALGIGNRSGVELWDSSDGSELASYYDVKYGRRLTFSPSGSRLAIWSVYGGEKVLIFDLGEDGPATEIEAAIHSVKEGPHQPAVTDVLFLSDDEPSLLVAEIGLLDATGRIEIQDAGNNTVLSVGSIGSLWEAVKYVCNEPVVYWDPPEPSVPNHMEISANQQIAALRYDLYGLSDGRSEISSLRFFRIEDGQLLYKDEDGIIDFELSPDGQTWVAGYHDGRLQVRRLEDGAVLDSVDAYESPLQNIAISSDNFWLGAAYLDEVKLYRLNDGTMQHHYPATGIAFSPDGKSFSLAYKNGDIELRSAADGSLINAIAAHKDEVSAMAFLPDGNLLTAGFDCQITEWNIPGFSRAGSLENFMVTGEVTGEQVPFRFREILPMPDGQAAIGHYYGGRDFVIWSMEDGKLIRTPAAKSIGYVKAVSADGEYLAGKEPDPWDYAVPFLKSEAAAAGFSPDSALITGGLGHWYPEQSDLEGAIRVWEVPDMNVLHTTRPRTGPISALAFTPDGRLIASGASDGVIRLWGIP